MAEKVINKTGGRLIPASFKQRDVSAAVKAGLVFGAVGVALTGLIVAKFSPPTDPLLASIKLGAGAAVHYLTAALGLPGLADLTAGLAKANARHLAGLAARGELLGHYLRLGAMLVGGLGLGGLVFKEGMVPKDLNQHVRGFRLLEDAAAIKEAVKQIAAEIAAGARNFPWPDIPLHPAIAGAWARWRGHTVIFGKSGSGKTVIFHHFIQDAMARGDRFIITDSKGDMVQQYPGAAIVSPVDARSLCWRVAADINSAPRARDFAENLIQSSHDPMWANSARGVLVGMLNKLITERPGRWNFRDLHELCSLPQEQILPMMQQYNPDAVRSVEGESVTTAGIMINLAAFIQPVADLSAAWGDGEPESAISFTEWLHDESTPIRHLIFQNHGQYSPTVKAVFVAIFNLIAAVIDSPDFADSPNRRIWLFLDELPAIGKVRIEPVLSRARSRDVRAVLGFQNMTQLKEIWGDKEAQTIIDNVETKIVSRVPPGETAAFISNMVGKAESERMNISESIQPGSKSKTLMHNREERAVIYESDLSSRLGVEDGGIRALVLGFRDYVMLLKWPFRGRPLAREAYVEAPWIKEREALTAANAAAAAIPATTPAPEAFYPPAPPSAAAQPAAWMAMGQQSGAPPAAPARAQAAPATASGASRNLVGESGGGGGFAEVEAQLAAIAKERPSIADQLRAIKDGGRDGSGV